MYTLLMNGHAVNNGTFDTLKQVTERRSILKGIFTYSTFIIVINI